MMDKGTEEQASCYVLGILEPAEAAQFERDLAASEELRLEVARLRDSLHAGFREGLRPVQPPESVHTGLRKRLKGSAPQRRVVWTWARGWAAAALLLFGLQLYQLQRPAQESTSSGESVAVADAVQPQGAGLVDATAEPAVVLRSRIEELEEALRTRDAELGENAQEMERIQQGMRSLAAESATVREAYARLAARVFPFFDGTEGLSRFTVIEMVDGRAQAGVPARRPFANLAEQFLTGFSRQQEAESAPPMGPFPEGMDGALQGNPDGLVAASLSEMGLARFHETSAAGSGDGTVELFDGDSTGFTVWRDDEQKGFLDVYNLPEAGAGRQAYLWVRASELESYVPVGTLPQLENGSGSVFYTIDEPDFSPVEVLITAEPEEGPGSQPDPGQILLRGP
jgi:hypothetical protein